MTKSFEYQFDLVASSQIKHENAKGFFQNVMGGCAAEMVKNYDPEALVSDAYRIKEMGDGFICSIGFPFSVPAGKGKSQFSIELSLRFNQAFMEEVSKFDYFEDIYCGMGIALGPVESYFPMAGAKQYDLFGEGIVLATRYESYRKQLFEITQSKGSSLIIQESIFASLNRETRDRFHEVNLETARYKIRDDSKAKKLYYLMLDKI